ncbi:bifunctional phosphoribosylaminoimidazolecarboxamide formyltransferase/IMP cyclohydrolase [Neomegalonema sp.]|uniref:bifunctional phosphoribosylaminoimidazolecarboxamide formyltransferase/IMP cyclohydrolase n=1 Tax=Neomegalonema sp. TaxID=2039713 RepID=UPI002616CB59|nr:bifunctional phosphoribosylaminoimidazolecarboxamide formyltransferase/IMP cyclohydrolase [Neomegalonema sp.]MDD2868828.1 bifunctional phosphoribosylaminoimidazolecarboxamide formyltransferase/IMP cyclohydrolase [Neomegalonema sp.]
MTDVAPVRRALISVSDKSGLEDFARALVARGVEILSTGGTARALAAAGIPVRDVSEVTGFPEMMDGRVKTLHPKVHGGLLALRGNAEHEASMAAHEIGPIDLLAVNLYPFEATLESGAGFDDCVENIDVGGPAMIRGAAKNHAHVAVAVEPEDYAAILADLEALGGTGAALRRRLAAKAFARTASYDAAIATWLEAETARPEDPAPRFAALGGRLAQSLRYGENPHQRAALYLTADTRPGAARARLIQGKELSYNNLNDADAAYELVAEFAGGAPACVIVKHANPCGVALGGSLVEAYERAHDCDRTSAFGGVVAVNRPLDRAAAEAITRIFTEVVIAPEADAEARAVFAAKKNLRLLIAGSLPDPSAPGWVYKPVAGGFLRQNRDSGRLILADLKIVTKRAPTEAELRDMLFAWRVAKHVKSNAIVYAKNEATVGVGAGQMSRVDSTRIAARKAEDMAEVLGLSEAPTRGSVVASDAFFPFPDGLLTAAAAGATAAIQPGGSVKDAEVIAAADDAGLAMVFSGMRHFRH